MHKLLNKIKTLTLLPIFFVLATFYAIANISSLYAYQPNGVFETYNIAFRDIPSPPTSDINSYILVDYNSGAILGEHKPHEIIEPASLTKVMTMYVIDKELAAGRITMDDEVKVSSKAWKMKGSRMFIEVNSEVKVSQLIKGIIIQSGNDASVAMAEHIAGSEEAFVQLMNQTAKDLGMNNTHFMNATGMPHKEHYTTAFDLALLSRAIIRDFPETYEIYSMKEFTYNDIKQFNRNKLLWSTSFETDGIKTGYTDSAGYCLAASAEKNGMRLIAVVMGAESEKHRSKVAASLLGYGYRFYDTVKIYAQNESIGLKKIWLGETAKLDIGLNKDLYITIPKGSYKHLSAKVDTKKYLKAPINKNESIGQITISLRDEIIAQKPIIALNTVDKGSLWQRLKDRVKLSLDSFLGHEHEVELKELT